MKKIIFKCSVLLAVIIIVQSCKPDKVPILKTPASVTTGFSGTWKLTQVIESDGPAVAKGFPFKTMDITNAFPYSSFSLTLNMDGNIPTTFTTVQGTSPKVIPITNGNWSFDDPAYPSVLILAGTTDTLKVPLSAYPTAASAQLAIAVSKYAVADTAKKSALITYNYLFTKQQ